MLTVATIMQTKPKTVRSDVTLTDLERLFLSTGYSGFPVVEDGNLVGVVTRSDVVRSLETERSRAEQISDYYLSTQPDKPESVQQSIEATAAQIGVRLAGLRVSDAMSASVVTIGPSESLQALAGYLHEAHLHRVPVVEEGRLVGVVTSMDIVRAVAEGMLEEREDSSSSQKLLP